MPTERLFLERQSYRLRRMMDAVRLLPIFGLCLWLVPMMWPVVGQDEGGSISTSTALRYIFCIWLLLCFSSWFLWRRTRGASSSDAGLNSSAPITTQKEPR